MGKLDCIIDDSTLGWLLGKDNPSVRYLTLAGILDMPETDPEVLDAKRGIMQAGTVPAVLARQNPDGSWGEPGNFYLDKYTGTVWQLMILAELGADPTDMRVRNACEFILENSQDRESLGFAISRSGKAGGGRHSEVIPCLTGNMAWSLSRLGYSGDVRVQGAVDWLCLYQRSDDGATEPPAGWPYDRYEMCFGRHSCHMGVVKSLKALSAIPPDKRGGAVSEKIGELSEYLLAHHIFKKSHDPNRISKPGWLKFGFPLMYQTDVLEILGILTDLGCHDARMEEAVEIVKSKQSENKHWKLENTFNGKMLEDIEAKGLDSKWITLKSLKVLLKW